ncbi:MAG: T9SS type A sorting domain-containing protein [Bacteroidales bacterium]
MKKTVYLISLLLLIAMGTQAQIKLVGMRGNQTTDYMDIVKWQALDPASVTAYPSLLKAYYMASSVFDAYNSKYYISGIGASASGLLEFNTATNEQSLINFSSFSNTSEIDMSTGKIYSLSIDQPGYIKVNEYDINTGTDTLIGEVYDPGINGIAMDALGIDSNNGIIYYVGDDGQSILSLFGIEVRNPVFTYTKTALTSPAAGNNMMSINYDNANNTIYALNFESNSSGSSTGTYVVEINKTTGEVVNRGQLQGFNGFLVGSSSFDQNSGSFLLVGYNGNPDVQMVVFDTYNNTYQTGFMPDNVSEIVCDNYDFAKNTYVTTSVKEAAKETICLSPNPASNAITIENSFTFTGNLNASIFDINGKLKWQGIFQNGNTFNVDISNLLPGVYVLKTETSKGVENHKFVVK